MTSNEHNPIALRVSAIQKIWMQKRNSSTFKVQIFHVLCHKSDAQLVNGFFRLEGSSHGSSRDSLLGFTMDFVKESQYLYDCCNYWIAGFKKEQHKHQILWEALPEFESRLALLNSDTAEELLLSLLHDIACSFKLLDKKEDNMLLLYFSPKGIVDKMKFVKLLINIVVHTPENIGIILLDILGHERFSEIKGFSNAYLKIAIPNQDMDSAYMELIKQGNPQDPQVQFRKYLMEMGKEAQNNNQPGLDHWGERLLQLGLNSPDSSFQGSTYLLYASFLFQFKKAERKIEDLLQQGIDLLSPQYKSDAAAAAVLMRIYAFRGSHYSMRKKLNAAIADFSMQADIAEELGQQDQAFLAYYYALLSLDRHHGHPQYKNMLHRAYLVGNKLPTELLKALNFPFVVCCYLEEFKIDPAEKLRIAEKLTDIYGPTWQQLAHRSKKGFDFSQQILKDSVPT